MKRILTLIVTLVCVFAAYSQNTVYIWKGNTLSVQAADSIAFCADNVVDLGLSVFWESDDACYGNNINWDDAVEEASDSGGRLPTEKEFEELFSRCSWDISKDKSHGWYNRSIEFIGPNGNKICLYLSDYDYRYWVGDNSTYYYIYYRYWTNRSYYLSAGYCATDERWVVTPPSFCYGSTTKCRARFVWDN